MHLNYKLLIHGGAGIITRNNITEAQKIKVIRELDKSLLAGQAILKGGGSAVDAVCAAVESMENSTSFNAGLGAVYAHSGHHLLEASVMDGATRNAGSVANCRHTKNPVLLAKHLLPQMDIVMLSGTGADRLADKIGLEMVPNTYFNTTFRKKQWEIARQKQGMFLDHSNLKMGTVGAVAIDSSGNLAAATSTGGMTNKPDGRIGDSALIGAGTYAHNDVVAVSCTGTGEYFIRSVTAYDVACLMEYAGLELNEAGRKAIFERMAPLGGDGGIIAIDRNGNHAMSYNSEGMYRGWITADKKKIHIWEEEEKTSE